MNYPDSTGPNDPEAPWNKEPQFKEIEATVRLQGIKKFKLTVPLDFDESNLNAVQEEIEAQHTYGTELYKQFRGQPITFWDWKVADLWSDTKPTDKDEPSIFIEGVEEV